MQYTIYITYNDTHNGKHVECMQEYTVTASNKQHAIVEALQRHNRFNPCEDVTNIKVG